MAGFKDREKRHFPLQNIKAVVNLVRDQLENTDQPNLALVSIVLGAIEHALTVNRTVPQDFNSRICLEPIFPVVELSTVEALYQKFIAQIKGSVDMSQHQGKFTSRELVKKVSDVLWAGLSRSFKDKAHLQSLYAYLTGNKLDCYGVSLGVVAACQVLGLNDVHLSLSEDHAWVVFGEHSDDTAEVTWHGDLKFLIDAVGNVKQTRIGNYKLGKGNEDKRGQSIVLGVAEKSWLYLNGFPVVCTRQMEIASIVSSINPGISATMDSVEMGSLQQELLWLLYDMGHLERYPMALGNLGDLEEISPSPGRPSPRTLYLKAIDSAVQYYNDYHVYPYTYMGGFCYRNHCFKEALQWWAGAANVIRKFNYSREDEEIYKEFMEISNELIPNVVKLSSEKLYPKNPNEAHLLRDPKCYALVLQFYDGICQWEEDSSTPVLHIGWAKHIISSLAKFEAQAREHLELFVEGTDSEDEAEEESEDKEKHPVADEGDEVATVNGSGDAPPPRKRGRPVRHRKVSESQKPRNGSYNLEEEKNKAKPQENNRVKFANGKADEDQIKNTIQELESKVHAESQEEALNPNIDALAKACGESILNPEYLISGPCGGEPFTANPPVPATTAPSTNRVCTTPITVDFKEFLSSKSNGSPFGGMTMDSMLKAESPADMLICKNHTRQDNEQSDSAANGDEEDSLLESSLVVSPRITLHSSKMKGLKHLLTAEKLNASAIKLQLTAQSVTLPKHSKNLADFDLSSRRKRLRRE